jgi:hypothetical protein
MSNKKCTTRLCKLLFVALAVVSVGYLSIL